MYFSKANHDSIIKKHGLSPKDVAAVGKALGAAWRKLSPAEKKPYEQQAEKDSVRYQKERSAMPPKVKGPLSAYMFFVNSNRASILKKHGVSPKNIRATGKALGDSWRKVSDQRGPFSECIFSYPTLRRSRISCRLKRTRPASKRQRVTRFK